VKARLTEHGIPDEQYLYTGGVGRALVAGPLERLGQPYVDARVPMADAAKEIVDALPPRPRSILRREPPVDYGRRRERRASSAARSSRVLMFANACVSSNSTL